MTSQFYRSTIEDSTEPTLVTAEDWFHSGRHVFYDPIQRRIVGQKTNDSVRVFVNVVLPTYVINSNTRWLTLLPGFPDGSYGYAKIADQLRQLGTSTPQLYVEYVGQGDSDKPKDGYDYSTIERADLVQALWNAHDIKRTVVVTYDYSSNVLFELLRRCHENRSSIIIDHIMIINGELFFDKRNKKSTYPYSGTPILFRPFIGNKMVQRSNLFVDSMVLKPMYSNEYLSKQGKKQIRKEIREIRMAIRMNDGTFFLSNGYRTEPPVKKKKSNGDQQQALITNTSRWNIWSIPDYCMNHVISVHLITSKYDRNEYQYSQAKERLGERYYPNFRVDFLPSGGHMILMEHAVTIAQKISTLTTKTSNSGSIMSSPAATASHRSWVTLF